MLMIKGCSLCGSTYQSHPLPMDNDSYCCIELLTSLVKERNKGKLYVFIDLNELQNIHPSSMGKGTVMLNKCVPNTLSKNFTFRKSKVIYSISPFSSLSFSLFSSLNSDSSLAIPSTRDFAGYFLPLVDISKSSCAMDKTLKNVSSLIEAYLSITG